MPRGIRTFLPGKYGRALVEPPKDFPLKLPQLMVGFVHPRKKYYILADEAVSNFNLYDSASWEQNFRDLVGHKTVELMRYHYEV